MRSLFTKFSALVVLVVMGTLANHGVAEEASPQQQAEIASLILQLGDSEFITREIATTSLTQLGALAEPYLMEARKNPDAEIRHRSSRILEVILERLFESRLREFAKDVDGSKNLTLPGWDRFQKTMGSDKTARKLFVLIQRDEPALMDSYSRNQKEVARIFGIRCQALQYVINTRIGNQRGEVSLGNVAGLLVVAADQDVRIPDQAGMQLYSLLHRPPFATALTNGETKPLLLKMLGGWIGKSKGLNAQLDYQKVALAMQHQLKEGLRPAIGIAKQPGGQPYYRLHSIMAIGKLGNLKEHKPVLEELLKDTAMCAQPTINKVRKKIEVRDAALVALLHLTKQDPKTFGYKGLQANTRTLYNPNSLYTESEKVRDAALEKWAKWSAENGTKQ